MTKLQDAPVFRRAATDLVRSAAPLPINLLADDGAGRIFVWNSEEKVLHCVQLHRSDDEPGLFAKDDYKTMKLSIDVRFKVRALKLNRTGELLLLAGDKAMVVMDIVPQASQIYRAGSIADDLFNGHSLRVLDVAWHPYSDHHIGVLSSDGVFRLFNLTLDPAFPEQEYHLQMGLCSRPGLEAYSRPASFAFGGDHFWDRFTVFIVFTDASIYALCPIVPFGSMHNVASLKELAKDVAQQDALRRYATIWLEIVFPDLTEAKADAGVIRARAQVPSEASLVLQGPLPKVWGAEKPPGHATGILYSTTSKDSIFTVCTNNGELLFYALADEIQPRWNTQNAPRVVTDEDGELLSVGMLVEPSTDYDDPQETGASEEQTPPVLHLATIDLALEPDVTNVATIGVFPDLLIPEKFYCYHALGLDTVQLQWLPFTDDGKPMQQPVVTTVLDTSPYGDTTSTPLLGATVVLDNLGATWLVAVTSSGRCAVIEMKPQRVLPPLLIEGPNNEQRGKPMDLKLMSPDLLLGPKDIGIPQFSPSSPLTLESVEGRSALHHHGKLLHEKYIEYAHRVHVELMSHYKYLGNVVDTNEKQIGESVSKLIKAEEGFKSLSSRIQGAFAKNRELQDRVRECNKLPGLRQRVLTTAERDFKSVLDSKLQQDVDILQTAVESLTLRGDQFARKQVKKQATSSPGVYHRGSPKVGVPDSQMRAMRVALDRVGQYVELGRRRVDALEQAIQRKEAALEF